MYNSNSKPRSVSIADIVIDEIQFIRKLRKLRRQTKANLFYPQKINIKSSIKDKILSNNLTTKKALIQQTKPSNSFTSISKSISSIPVVLLPAVTTTKTENEEDKNILKFSSLIDSYSTASPYELKIPNYQNCQFNKKIVTTESKLNINSRKVKDRVTS